MAIQSHNRTAIFAVSFAMLLITLNDSVIKSLSDAYSLYQIMMVRAMVSTSIFGLVMYKVGGVRLLRTRQPGLHTLRSIAIVMANLFFFMSLAVMPLAQATALFFVAPFYIMFLSAMFLGHRVGIHRIAAVCVGFGGVLTILSPNLSQMSHVSFSLVLPLIAALFYAVFQTLTRALGPEMHPVAMAFYSQLGFAVISLGFGLICGGGGCLVSDGAHPSIAFVLRAWGPIAFADLWRFAAVGVLITGVSWFMTLSYRLSEPASVAPFEYTALPMAVLFGAVFFREMPVPAVWVGMALIAGAGLYILWRERKSDRSRNVG